MPVGKVPEPVRAAGAFTVMTNAQFAAACVQIGKTAPSSPKYALLAVKSAADAVVKDGLDLAAAVADADSKQAAADAAKLHRDVVRQRGNKNGGVFVKTSESVCVTDEELQSLALMPRARHVNGSSTPPPVPTVVTTASGTVVGGANAICKAVKGVKIHRLEISVDPIAANSWTEVPGTYARRKITGLVSGAKYWVRFATVRGNLQSAWSTPVLVIAR